MKNTNILLAGLIAGIQISSCAPVMAEQNVSDIEYVECENEGITNEELQGVPTSDISVDIVHTGNGTTYIPVDMSTVHPDFSWGAFYSMTKTGDAYFNDITYFGLVFQTWTDSETTCQFCVVDEADNIISIRNPRLVNVGDKTYIYVESDAISPRVAIVESDIITLRDVCCYDGIIINDTLVMEF